MLTSATVVLTLILSFHYAIPYTEWLPRSKMAAERCFLKTLTEDPLPFFDDLPWACGIQRDVTSDGRRLWPTLPKLQCCYQSLSMSEISLMLPNDKGKGWRLPPEGVDAAELGYELVLASCEGADRASLHFIEPPTTTRAPTRSRVVSVVLLKVRGLDQHPLLTTWSELWKADAVHMDTYMQLDSSVEDRPDVLAALTGVPEFDFPSRCLRESSGNCPWIWKRFADAGAATLLLEDSPCVGDFVTRPTDVWLRPLSRVLDAALREFDPGGECPAASLSRKWLGPCLRTALGAKVRGVAPFWAMVYVTASDALDVELAHVLHDVLERAVVILMADQRLSVAVPKWFRNSFPEAVANLRVNKRRYTTPFDVHETMVHLSDVRSLTNISLDSQGTELNDVPGRSLFLSVPEWTLRDEEPAAPSEQQVRRAASAMASLLNQRLARKDVRCKSLSVQRVVRAESLGSDLLLVVETAPGGVEVHALMGLGDHEPGSMSLKSVVPADLETLCLQTPADTQDDR